ncbi:hypothetical protein PVAP13_4NG305338 [Panicum virgatum]|uniref:Uncharacterized protein n=1 Tax=Panicum virgatum TaxID=38727 RepID=A0A8T0TGL1_PANVG|nr:hypothetical protein PVAP13_4NG305338 [Panicum virgatum]KAG2608255.1 hypothetical protein PVAP13_4NG305338 [Panicum virgatum]
MACRTQPADDNDEHRPLGSEDAASTLTPDAAAKVRERDDLPAGQQPPPRLRRPEDGEARSRRHPPLRCCSAGRSNDRLFVIKLTRAPATPCPVPFFSSHLSSPFPSASVAPGSFRCCRPPPCRFPLLRAFLPASVPHPGTRQLRLFFDPLSFSTSLDSDCTIAWRQFICLLGFDYVRVSMMATVRRWR